MRAAIYIRVSSKKQLKGVSLEDQERICREYAARMGWLVSEVYADRGVSGRRDDRPALTRLKEDARRRAFNVVLFYKINRLGRNMADSYAIAAEIERHGIEIASVTESFDRKTAAGKLTFGMLALVAQFESDQLAEKMAATRKAEALQGRHSGPVPVGYTRIKGRLAPSPQADAVQLIGQLYATGDYSAVTLAQAVNEAGYRMPDGAPFKPNGIKEIVRCPVYAGFVVCGDALLSGSHEALWSAALWARIQEVSRLRSQRRTRPNQAHEALLCGLAVCARCGAPLWHQPNSCGIRYYRCAAAKGRQISPAGLLCTVSSVHAEPIEQMTLDWIGALGLLPDLINDARRLLEQPAAPGPSRAEIEQKIRRLARAYADGAYTDEEYEARRSALFEQLRDEPQAQQEDPEAILALLADLPVLLSEAPSTHRRAIVRELVNEVYVARGAVLALRPTRLAQTLFDAVDTGEWYKLVRDRARRASDVDTPYWLKRSPVILAAA